MCLWGFLYGVVFDFWSYFGLVFTRVVFTRVLLSLIHI